jgi:hypothetical protein
MNITVEFSDDDGFIRRLQTLPDRLDNAVKLGIQAASGEAKREIVGREGLTKYPRHRKGTPTSSPAGDPPAQISTNLRQSVQSRAVQRHGFADYSQTTLPGAVYARVQELGWAERGIPARPFVRPAVQRLRHNGKIDRIFRARLKEALNGG